MTRHPCGALPVDAIGVTAWYCETHQAWWARVDTWRQTTDDHLQVGHSAEQQFGPFDTRADVMLWFTGQLSEQVAAVPPLDAPWDRRP